MSKEEKMIYRNRTHMIELYPDNESHVKALKKIKESYDYAYILHDKDEKEDDSGELKKPHWHVVVRFANQKWNTALSEELGIEIRFTREPRNFDNVLLYLIHFNDSDKYQYNIDEVHGPLKKRLKELINKQLKSEGEKVFELIEYIEMHNRKITIKEFAKYCAQNGYWSEFRRSGSIFCRMIDEHNMKFIES